MTYMNMKLLELSLVWKHLKIEKESRECLIKEMWVMNAALITVFIVNMISTPVLDDLLVVVGVLALPIVVSRAVFIVRIGYANGITDDKFHDACKSKTEIVHGFLVWFEYFINPILVMLIMLVMGGILYATFGRTISFDREQIYFLLGLAKIGIGMAICSHLNMWLISRIEKERPFLKKKRLNDQWIWKTHVMQADREVATDV